MANGISDETYAKSFALMYGGNREGESSIVFSKTEKVWKRDGHTPSDMKLFTALNKACELVRAYTLASWGNCVFSAWVPKKEVQKAEERMDTQESIAHAKAILALAAEYDGGGVPQQPKNRLGDGRRGAGTRLIRKGGYPPSSLPIYRRVPGILYSWLCRYAQSRSYRVASHLATQARAQMAMGGGRDGKNFVELVSTNARNLVIFPGVSKEDAKFYSEEFGEYEKVEVVKSRTRKRFSLITGGLDRLGHPTESIREQTKLTANFTPTDIRFRPFGEIAYCIIKNNSIQKPKAGKVKWLPKE